ENKTIKVDCLNPATVLMEGRSMLAIHTSTPTTGIQKSDIKVHFTVINEATETKFVADVKEVKKHLLKVEIPDVRCATANERLKGFVVVHSHGGKSEKLNIQFETDLPNSSKRNPETPPKSGIAVKRAPPS
ncbi:hypothetical protein BOX15_Mlig016889g2, partial [Macrostomum lignano]